jgi:hypothetical protein
VSTATVRMTGLREALVLAFEQLSALPKNLSHTQAVIDYLSTPLLPDTASLSEADRVRCATRCCRFPPRSAWAGCSRTSRTTSACRPPADRQPRQHRRQRPAGLQPPGIAANLRDREYFVEAMQRGQSSQFLFGRLTRTPGLYFAQRVDVAASRSAWPRSSRTPTR